MSDITSINEQLDILDETKAQIKQAIIDKGQEISDEDSFRSYAEKIAAIVTEVSNLNVPVWYVGGVSASGGTLEQFLSGTLVNIYKELSAFKRMDYFTSVVRTNPEEGDIVILDYYTVQSSMTAGAVERPTVLIGNIAEIEDISGGAMTFKVKVWDGISSEKLSANTLLKPENIKLGVTVFGVQGNLQPEDPRVAYFSSVAEMNQHTDLDEGTFGVVADVNFQGVYQLTNSVWLQVGEQTQNLQSYEDLAEVLGGTEEEYEGLGGTEEEIVEILEEVLNGEEAAE